MEKINVKDLRIGMFVHDICGRWIDLPFWKKSFMIDSFASLKILQNSPITEVWIDPEKGRKIGDFTEEDDNENPDEENPPQEPLRVISPQPKKKESEIVGQSNSAFFDEFDRFERLLKRVNIAIAKCFSSSTSNERIDFNLIQDIVSDVSDSIQRHPTALVSLLLTKKTDSYQYQHAFKVSAMMVALGRQIGMESSLFPRLALAGLMMDIGKIFIPEDIIKKREKLTVDEYDIVKKHPVLGFDLLKKSGLDDEIVLDVCLHHHERIDGSGYPDKLAGSETSVYAKMAAVCDVYDAIVSERGFGQTFRPADAIRKLALWQENQYDNDILHAFVRIVGLYPVGTMVLLSSKLIGTVIEQTRDLTRPIVKIFYSFKQDGYVHPRVINLLKVKDTIEHVEDKHKLGILPPWEY